MRLYLFVLAFLFFTINISGQAIDSTNIPDIKEYLRFYEGGLVKRIQRDMPLLKDKYPNTPEVIFFEGLFEENAEIAFAKFQEILRNFGDAAVTEHALFRIAQYNFAKKQYYTAKKYYSQLINEFPETAYLKEVDEALKTINTILGVMPEESEDSYPLNLEEQREFIIQIGAYAVDKNAIRMKKFLENQGYKNVEISREEVRGDILNKVWIRGFTSKREALKEADYIKSNFGFEFTIFENK